MRKTHTVAHFSCSLALEGRFIACLQACKSSNGLSQIQTQIITHGFQNNLYLTPRIVSVCGKLNIMSSARKLFDQMPKRDVSLFNSMFKGYVQNEMHRQAVVLFGEMKRLDVIPNCYTFPMVVKSCEKLKLLSEGEQVFCYLTKIGFKNNPFVGTAVVEMYSSIEGRIGCAHKCFLEMPDKNVVAWTLIIRGYISVGDVGYARCLFDLAPERDVVLWNIMVSGYIEAGDMVLARKLFDEMPNRDVMALNTLLCGYANNGDVEACEKLFEEMTSRNIFSWNGLIGGYARNGLYSKVLNAFKRMLSESDVVPNDATLVAVLSACARLGALDLGKWVHVYVKSNSEFDGNVYIGNALIDMYAKCGMIKSSMDVFRRLSTKDLISWNTVIGGLAIHGNGADALKLFSEMRDAGERPDGITFLGVLCACMHMGLVEDGVSYFKLMLDDYSITPQIEHYGCLVDLLARAGHIDRAVSFVKKMPMEADAVIWASLLGACRTFKNIEVAELALEQLIRLEPNNPANYVMLSNIYGDAGRRQDLSRLKLAMRDTGFKKLPGCSSIEVDNSVVEFYSLDERHPKTDKIYETLGGLTKLLKSIGYLPDLTFI